MESGRTEEMIKNPPSSLNSSSTKSNMKRASFKRSGTTNTYEMDACSTHSRGSLRWLSKIEPLDKEIQEQANPLSETEEENMSSDNSRQGQPTISRAMSCSYIEERKSHRPDFKRPSLVSMSSGQSILKRRESCPNFKREAQTVSFGAVEFRLHQRTAGDNPSVSDRGPAFDLDWEYTDGPCESIDDYESLRTTENPRRSKIYLRVKGHEREKMLKYDNDVSTRAIQTSIMSITKAKADRKKTLKKMKYEKIDAIGESLKRKVKKLFGKICVSSKVESVSQ